MVSWLPPKHPKAVSSEPAAKLREKLLNPNDTTHHSTAKGDEDKDEKRKSSKLKDRETYRERDEKRHGKYDEKERVRKKPRKDDIIDPMDPAAYSDVPQVKKYNKVCYYNYYIVFCLF